MRVRITKLFEEAEIEHTMDRLVYDMVRILVGRMFILAQFYNELA